MSSTDYLLICGRASAHSMESASATLDSPLDSSKHIIAQVLRPAQRFLMQGFQLSAFQLGFPLASCTDAAPVLQSHQ